MKSFLVADLKKLYIPPPDSHKGQNGKLLIIGGSHLFHAASLWALKVASRIVDMVFYSSVPENNEIVQKAKEEFRDGIVVRREDIESYIEEADCILIGPGMLRNEKLKIKNEKSQLKIQNLDQINNVKEFERLFGFKIQNSKFKITGQKPKVKNEIVKQMAGEYNCIILLKGLTDVVCSPKECVQISGGNAGMTKGGTGDVLAGLVAALSCKNDLFLAAAAGSFINKKAGESLFKRVGPYFNASDLADEIPRAMKELILT
ncbi:MAG: hydroxyethylthiazole kinase [Candidatus Levybacteria bacterium]|nr:hydroxyethylthiazole kinase [Candidatus Levybacteria bacterium]